MTDPSTSQAPSSITAGARLEGPGDTHVGRLGITILFAYVVAFSAAVLWGLYGVWDEISSETRSESVLFRAVLYAGALGALVHATRSLYWYVGNRNLMWSWVLLYLLRPIVGGSLAVIFYIVVRGGLFSSEATPQHANALTIVALGGLVGLFSEQAVMKLKRIAETIFTRAEKGSEHTASKDEGDEREDDS